MFLPDVRVGAADSCHESARQRSRGDYAYGATVDQGLRTLSGGQISIQVEGYLAMQTDAAPPLVMEDCMRREIFSRWCEKRRAEGRSISTAAGQHRLLHADDRGRRDKFGRVNGFGLPPLAAGAQVSLDITAVPGRRHAAGARPDGDHPALRSWQTH